MTTAEPRPSLPAFTRPELDVMKALWREGRLGAREVHDRVGAHHSWAYSTTRTTLERMVKKGLVHKQEFHGLYVYAAAVSKARGLAGMVRDFAESVLEADYAPVVSLFADANTLSQAEIDELNAVLEEAGTGDAEGDPTGGRR